MRAWLYHATEEARIFEGAEYETALANGWAESPAKAKQKTVKDTVIDDVMTRDELISMAESLGVEVDKRWGVIRLREAIESATKA